MPKAKQTLDQYNQTIEEGRSKLQPLFDEKEKKREALKLNLQLATDEEKKAARDLYKFQSKRLNESRKEKNADLITKYQELYTQKKLDEATFQKGLEEFRKLDPEIDEQILKDLFMGKTEKKESKEILTKSLEFEEDTFKIDSTGRKETSRDVRGGKSIKVKENATGDVVEYLEGTAKGEQIFITYYAFIREVMKAKNCNKEEAEKKYLMTIDEFEKKMKDKPYGSEKYKKFFNEEVENHLAGFWISNNKDFLYIGVQSSVWLAGGDYAIFNQYSGNTFTNNHYFGFSGRLLKN